MQDIKRFGKNEVIIEEGTVGSVAYVIKSGSVEVSKGVGEETFVLSTLGEGSIFGEMGLIDDKPRSATVKALEETEVRVITREHFESLLEKNPRGMIPLLKQVFNRVRYLNQMVTAFCSHVGTGNMELRPTLLKFRALTDEAERALKSKEAEIRKIPYQIGRSSRQSIFGSNDMDLHDIEPYQISRCHCLITFVDREYCLVDSVSSKGTVVDAFRIGGREERKSVLLEKGTHKIVLGGDESPYVYELEVP
jgi:CRP/FNR family cyclic AMP-dependent transcriptional regulator